MLILFALLFSTLDIINFCFCLFWKRVLKQKLRRCSFKLKIKQLRHSGPKGHYCSPGGSEILYILCGRCTTKYIINLVRHGTRTLEDPQTSVRSASGCLNTGLVKMSHRVTMFYWRITLKLQITLRNMQLFD